MFEKILNFLGIVYDVAENVRPTETDIKDNNEMKRYEVQVSSNSDILDEGETPTSRKEYEKYKKMKSKKETLNHDENVR